MSQKIPNPFLNTDWLESQKQYMDAWKSFSQFMPNDISGGSNAGTGNPWSDAMDAWWKSVSPSAPATSQPFMGKMLEQGKVFYMLSEQFTTILQNMNEMSKASDDWQSMLNDQFNQMKSFFASGNNKDSLHGMMGAWQLLPMDTLQRTFSSSSIMPGDFLEEFKPRELQEATDKFLSMPGVGYTRESQEQALEGVRLSAEYQKISQEYNNVLAKTGIDALELMRNRIIEMAAAGEDINSLRQIYDIWVDCNEEAYAELAYRDDFSELYGKLTNSLMAVKLYGRNVVDETLGALNMPTRKGLNTMQERQQELRRSHKVANRKIETLEEELAAIKKQLNGASSRKTASASKKKTSKKTESSKQAKTKKKVAAKKKSATKKKTSRKKSGDDMITIKI